MVVNRYLLDSDILIEHLRGQQQARTFIARLRQDGELLLSAITVAELFAGARDAGEQEGIDALLRLTRVIPVDEKIARRGGAIRATYRQSHGTGLADALIAASAELNQATFVSFNQRHFPMIANLQIPYER